MSLSNKQIIDLLLQSDLANKKNILSLMSMSKEILHEDRILSRSVMEKARDISMNECVKGNVGFYDAYTDSLKYLAQDHYDFDAYMLFTEQNREAHNRFYLPRRRLIKSLVVDHMQDLMDDKLDLLTVSLPPGTGKAQPLDSPILTPNGWVRMGDLKIGDRVMSRHYDTARVIGMFPKGVQKVYKITLDNGASCECTSDHIWNALVYGGGLEHAWTSNFTLEQIDKMLRQGYSFRIPMEDGYYNGKIIKVEYVREAECQCIYVDHWSHLYVTNDHILTHNTTIEEMFISFVMGHFPNKPNLFSSFSGFMTRMFYDAVDNFIESNEYCWSDVFPEVKMESTNAKEETINLDRWQPFKTLTCRPINASLTGNTRCEGYLCVDDLVSGIEEALSKERLDKLFNKYGTDLKTRRKVGAKEIHLATRWSVHDVIGRLQRQYEGSPRARFVAVPDIDPTTGRSNFEYDYGVGFTVKYFTDIAATMDEISYRCMFKSEPIEREGILYNADQLKRYLNLPMDDEGNVLKPDAVFSVCDTKDTGKDYNAHVCIKQYGNNYYLDDVVFKNIDPGTLDYLNADMIVRNKVQMSQFESNKEGSRTANEVERIVTEKGWFCHFTKKYTTQNKETKIIINSPWVLEHVYFKDPSLYPLQSDYANFIKFLCSWTQLGKNTHDDAPDVMAMVAIFVAEMLGGQVQVMSREDLGF